MKIVIANNFIKRLRGLMFRKEIGDDEALLLVATSRVHSSFMNFSIGVHYLDKDYRIIDYQVLRPWRIGKKVRGARHIIETSERVGLNDKKLIEAIGKLEVR